MIDISKRENNEIVKKRLSLDEAITFLLDQEPNEYLYFITEYDDHETEEDGTPLILEQLNGEEWLADNL